MSNPFAQDPFGELSTTSTSATRQPAAAAELRPTRRAPPKPVAAPPLHNPFSQQPQAPAAADPFELLAASAAPAAAASAPQASPAAPQQQQQPAVQWDDDVFGLFSSAQAGAGQQQQPAAAPAPALPPPPSYTDAVATALPPPPSYDEAAAAAGASLSAPPPPYDAAGACPAAAPPSYEDVMGTGGSINSSSSSAQLLRPARAAPPAPPPAAAAVGPLTASRPSRPAPAAPGGVNSSSSSLSPARPAPAAPSAAAANSSSSLSPARPAPRAPPQAAAAADAAAAGLSSLALSAASSGGSGSGSKCVAATTGNVGAAPSGSVFGGQQVHQQELGALLRLPPLNPKATAPLKHLAAGMGCLFAGPVDASTLLLQYCPTASGSTLPMGGTAHRAEDHDSAAAAALGVDGHFSSSSAAASGGSSGKQGRMSCVLFGGVPGRLWAGSTDGRVHCWSVAGDGSVARLLHSWEAHSGKVKALALSPSGRLFTGSASGAVKMWSYGNPAAFTDSSTPRLLRQLKKVDARSGVAGTPHGKVVGLAVSAGGRVLWSVGKDTVSLWSTHNGEHLGSLSESGDTSFVSNPFAAGPHGSAAGFPQQQQQQQQGLAGAGSGDINPKHGLEPAALDGLFERPSAELLSEEDAFDSERDAASVAYNAAVKGAAKAGKLLNKLTKLAAAKINDGRDGGAGGGAGREDADFHARSFPSSSSHTAAAAAAAAAGGGSVSHQAAAAADAGLESKVERWGSIKGVVPAADGSMWLRYKRGLLEKYTEGGRLLWSSCSGSGTTAGGSVAFKPAGGITALAAVGSSVWVGDQQGRVWVLDAGSARVQRTWKAHVFPVRSIAGGGGAAVGPLVYTLGKAGGIRAWPALPPPPELTAAWRADAQDCLQQQTLQVLACTWNVNETRPSRHGLELWLGDRARDAQLVLIGLQEVEMGTGSVALDVVYQQLAKAKLEAGTQAAQAWAAAISDVLCSRGRWKRVALRQMSGILALVFARSELEPHIGEVATASVACGVMGYGGNKGAAAISFSLFRRRVVLVSSHFAAHQDKVDARNADYAKIVRHLHFHNVPTDSPQTQSAYDAASAVVLPNSSGPDAAAAADGGSPRRYGGGNSSISTSSSVMTMGDEDWGAGMKDAELLVWVGDFNYRVDAPEGFVPDRLNPQERPVNEQLYRFVLQKIAARQHADLLTGDQCSREMARGTIFHGLAEGPIRFLPTYKFEKGRESSAMQPFYDQGEKMRVPAWTDRVLFRASQPQRAALQPNSPPDSAADVRVSLASADAYSAVLEVNDSDHKPVYAQLALQLPWYQQQQLRSTSLARLWQMAQLRTPASSSSSTREQGGGGVQLLLEPQQQLVLQGSHVPRQLTVCNPLQDAAVCFAVCSGAAGVPAWLEVVPASGVLRPGETINLRVQGSKGSSSWGRGSVGLGAGGGCSCELRVVGCVEGSVDSSLWPLGLAGSAAAMSVVLH